MDYLRASHTYNGAFFVTKTIVNDLETNEIVESMHNSDNLWIIYAMYVEPLKVSKND